MSNYELIYIVNPEISDNDLSNVQAKINSIVAKIGGTVVNVNNWGRKKLAYPIKKFGEGNYIFTQIEMKSSATKELEANLKLANEVLRHLLIKAGA